jgi:hydrogenase-4 component B
MTLVLAGLAVLAACAGFSLTFGSADQRIGQWAGLGGTLAASVVGIPAAVAALVGGGIGPEFIRLPWMEMLGGSFSVELDVLSAFFVLIVLLLSPVTAIYASEYMQHHRGHGNLGRFWACFLALVASMLLVIVARNGLLFVAAWEIMALTSYFLVTFDGEHESVCRAGWIYLVATHLGALFLLVFFALLGDATGATLDFAVLPVAENEHTLAGILFCLAVIGFGSKAGVVPFHVWLPEAHPAAPSPVSALLSAAMIKVGIYGLLRTSLLVASPAIWWGPVLMALGLLGALMGAAQALYQRDLKRVLAFSSVENIGLIVFAIGVGLWGQALGQQTMEVLGFAAALLHIWNHALIKGMMFLAGGSLARAAGTRDLEKLGGLGRRMPWTAGLFILGAVALAALPPLPLFMSEWLLYVGLLQIGIAETGGLGLSAALTLGCLALVGGVAAIAFVRLLAIACLGEPRGSGAASATESGPAMRWPLAVLASVAIVTALVPGVVLRFFAPVLRRIISPGSEVALEATIDSLQTLGWVNLGLAAAIGGAAVVLMRTIKANGSTRQLTWDCGYAAPTARMQYTGSSFAELMGDNLLPRPFRPRSLRPAVTELFPAPTTFVADDADPVSQRGYVPLFHWIGSMCMRLWWVQHGTINLYLLYLMIAVVLGFAWMSVRGLWAAG